MEDIVGPLVFGAIAIGIAIFVLWVIAAALMRVLAVAVFYWIATFAIGLTTGIVLGLVLPIRVLSGRAKVTPDLVSPVRVADGEIIALSARGAAQHFGWDRAWPVYNPYQAQRDGRAVIAETQLLITVVLGKIKPRGVLAPKSTASGAKKPGLIKRSVFNLPTLGWFALVGPPIVGVVAGIWISIGFWMAIMALFGGAVYLCQQAWVLGYRWLDQLTRHSQRASLKCHKCYRETTTPSYRCSNAQCSVIHRNIAPGPLGVVHRRCDCGTRLPTTVRAAAKVLEAVCPFCNNTVAEGSGSRRAIQLPLIGAVAAGKTRLFSAGVVIMQNQLATAGGTFTPLTDAATRFRDSATNVMSGRKATQKTQDLTPEGLPYLAQLDGKPLEIHLMDVAGEAFRSMDSTQKLAYIDQSNVVVLVIDPLAFPRVREEAGRTGADRRILIATGDQEDSYASVVDRLRAENVDLRKRSLAVVVSKVDVLLRLPSGGDFPAGHSEAIRNWLVQQDQDGLVRRVEDDFGTVQYFGVDSFSDRRLDDPLHPAQVFHWFFQTSGAPLPLVPTPEPSATSPNQ